MICHRFRHNLLPKIYKKYTNEMINGTINILKKNRYLPFY